LVCLYRERCYGSGPNNEISPRTVHWDKDSSEIYPHLGSTQHYQDVVKDYSTQLIFGLLDLYSMKDYMEQHLVPLQILFVSSYVIKRRTTSKGRWRQMATGAA
jgi:hypothetical protein